MITAGVLIIFVLESGKELKLDSSVYAVTIRPAILKLSCKLFFRQ